MNMIQLYLFTINESGSINTDAPGVPLIYVDADGKTEEEIASAKGRNTVGVVFAQIEADLLKAVENLESGYERPSYNYFVASVANGFLARYYLLSQQWEKAAAAAGGLRHGGAAGCELVVLSVRPAPDVL